MHTRQYDLILWGASGFTGRLVAEYLTSALLSDHTSASLSDPLNWAVAGRNREKLQETLNELGHPQVPILIADGFNKDSLLAMAAQARVVCTTVGPYTQYGSLLVEACVASGTHYCDLSGEAGWMRQMIDRYHQAAKDAKIKIVHSCGFDSIPSDMGVYFLQKEIHQQYGVYATHIKTLVKAAKGGLSGGTFASMIAQINQAKADRSFARLIANPYTLNPDPTFKGPDRPDFQGLYFDPVAKSWIAPFVMAGINTRIVRRSHALQGFPYGEAFTYEEAMMTGKGLKGRMRGIAMLLMLGVLVSAKPKGLLQKIVLRFMPKPGEGPSKAVRESGYFYFVLYGTLPDGKIVKAQVKGDRDPGYGSTSKMLAECAVCLAKDEGKMPGTFGVLTASTAMGDALLERLIAHAGLSFEVV